jgi:hypothetical protein
MSPKPQVLFTNVKVFDGLNEQLIENANVLVEGNLIKQDSTLDKPQFRNVPCVDGCGLASPNFTSHRWSVQPCVRPTSAVRMTAGHNALSGSRHTKQ